MAKTATSNMRESQGLVPGEDPVFSLQKGSTRRHSEHRTRNVMQGKPAMNRTGGTEEGVLS